MSIFVASPVDVLRNEEADERLRSTNDARFLSERGVVAVDATRWQQAQQYERETWLTYNPTANNDRNDDHKAGFGGYAALPADLGDAIEVGCGPFTNLRLILTEHTARSVTLLDPLLSEYQAGHVNCSYRDGSLSGYPTTLINSPIEDWQPATLYDTLAIINVLPHCYDADKVLDRIWQAIRPGGLLIFNEAPSEADPTKHYDVGHPILVRASVIEAFLSKFNTVYVNGCYVVATKPEVQ